MKCYLVVMETATRYPFQFSFFFFFFVISKTFFPEFLNCNPIKCLSLHRKIFLCSIDHQNKFTLIRYYRPLRSNCQYFLHLLHIPGVNSRQVYSFYTFKIGFLSRGKPSSPTNDHTVSTSSISIVKFVYCTTQDSLQDQFFSFQNPLHFSSQRSLKINTK